MDGWLESDLGSDLMKNTQRNIVVLLLLMMPFLVFPRAFLGDRVVSAHDHLSVHPVFQETPGGAVQNPSLSDPAVQFAAFRGRVVSALRAGRAPLWNPDIYAGAPLLANAQSAPFSVPTLLHCAFPAVQAQNLSVFWLLLWPSLGTFLLLRKMGVQQVAALCGATACLNLPFLQVWLLHPHASTYVWLPWIVFAVESLKARGPPVLLAATTFGALCGGHPQTAAHVLLLAAAWALWRQRRLRVLLGMGAGVLCSAPVWLPFLENLANSATVAAHGGNRLALGQVLDLVWPNFHGHPALEGYGGPGIWADGVLNPGLGCLLLSVFAVRGRIGRALWIAFLVSVFLALLGLPLANTARLASVAVWLLALASAFAVARFSLSLQWVALFVVFGTGQWARMQDQTTLPTSEHIRAPADWSLRLADELGPNGRVVGLGRAALQPNTSPLAGLRDLRGYDLPVSKDWERYAASLDPRLIRPDFPIASYQIANSGMLAFAGVAYLISEEPIPGLQSTDFGPAPIVVSSLPEPGVRAWLADGTQVAKTQQMALRIVRNDPLARARPPVEGLAQGWPGTAYQPIPVDERNPENIWFNIDVDSNKLLVLADAWSPGWSVRVDGATRPLHRVGGYFKGVVVQPGDKSVHFKYHPKGWVYGKWLAVIGLVWLVFWSLMYRFGTGRFGMKSRHRVHPPTE